MTSINITAAEPNKVDAPAQPVQNPQQNQQPGDQSQQQGGAPADGQAGAAEVSTDIRKARFAPKRRAFRYLEPVVIEEATRCTTIR